MADGTGEGELAGSVVQEQFAWRGLLERKDRIDVAVSIDIGEHDDVYTIFPIDGSMGIIRCETPATIIHEDLVV